MLTKCWTFPSPSPRRSPTALPARHDGCSRRPGMRQRPALPGEASLSLRRCWRSCSQMATLGRKKRAVAEEQ